MERLPQLSYRAARREIEDGDILLFRNGGLIAWADADRWTHAATAVLARGILFCAESREFKGARIVTLHSQVRRYPGKIDVFRPKCSAEIRTLSAELALKMAGHAYAYRDLLVASLLRMPLVRLVAQSRFGLYLDATADTHSTWHAPKYCSMQALWCLRQAALWRHREFDPVPLKADRFVTPSDLAHSAGLKPMFTLVL